MNTFEVSNLSLHKFNLDLPRNDKVMNIALFRAPNYQPSFDCLQVITYLHRRTHALHEFFLFFNQDCELVSQLPNKYYFVVVFIIL